jgi:hypothetical protein
MRALTPVILAMLVPQLSADEAVDPLFLELDGIHWSVQPEKGNRLDQILTAITAKGDAVIEPMLAFCDAHPMSSSRHRALDVLARIGSPKAKATLLDLALRCRPGPKGHDWRNQQFGAAAMFGTLCAERSDETVLIGSDHPEVISMGLRAIPPDRALDEKTIRRLCETLAVQGCVHVLTLRLLGRDPGGALPAEKVGAVLGFIGSRVENGIPVERPQMMHELSPTHEELWNALEALRDLKGADAVLATAQSQAKGLAGEILFLARCGREQPPPGAAERIRAVAKIHAEPLLRLWAVGLLAVQGTEKDLSLLETIAAKDPWETPNTADVVGPDTPKTVWPVRASAERTIRAIRKRQAPPKSP